MIALSLAAAVAGGAAVLRACGARGAFAASAGVVAGLALVGASFSAGLLLFGATGAGADLLLLAGAALLWWRTRPNPSPIPAGPPRESPPLLLIAACAAVAAVVAALFVEQSIRYPDGNWDAFAIWNLRARALYRAPHDLALVFTGELPAQHPYYPPLLPSLIAHGWFALGASTPAVPIAVSLLFGAAGVVALAAAVAERRGPALGLAAALLLLGTPELLTLATNQYADLKLAMLLLVAVVLASSERFVAAGLVAGLCAYTKNEGLLEFAALWVAIFVVSGRRAALRFLAGAALPLALLGTFEAGWAPRNALVADLRLTDILHRAPGRLLLVLRGFAAQLVDFPAWGCTLPFVFLCWMVGFRRSERTVPAVFVALSIAVFFAIYLTTPHDPAEHMASSLDRLLFQIWPSLIYATAVSLLSGEARAGVAPLRSAADRA